MTKFRQILQKNWIIISQNNYSNYNCDIQTLDLIYHLNNYQFLIRQMFDQVALDSDKQESQYIRNQLSNQHSIPSQELQKIKKREKRKKEKGLDKLNIGHWNNEEKKRYVTFLTQHKQNFSKKELRRSDKIFKSMSTYIATRTPDQCRSHHQKMEKKYKNLQNILRDMKLILSHQHKLVSAKSQVINGNEVNKEDQKCTLFDTYSNDSKQEPIYMEKYKQNDDLKQTAQADQAVQEGIEFYCYQLEKISELGQFDFANDDDFLEYL